MTKPSLLRNFGWEAVDELYYNLGVRMVYDGRLRKNREWGAWELEELLVKIEPQAHKGNGKREEVTILHEWLHAYAELLLPPGRDSFRETQIEWWAYHHHRESTWLTEHIRGYFREEGF